MNASNRHSLFASFLCTLALGYVLIPGVRAGTTAFTYQGRLSDAGTPAEGSYDLRFTLYDASSEGTPVSTAISNTATHVTDGLFTVALDFGADVFNGADRWLDIGVRTNGTGAPFTDFLSRHALTPTPYAIRSLHASSALTAVNADTAYTVIAGAVGTDTLMENAVTSAKIADQTISETDLNPILSSNTFWRLDGNTGTASGTHFLGTTDDQPLEFKVNGTRLFRLERTGLNTANIIGGSPGNYVAPGLDGVTIAGGGVMDDTLSLTNTALADFASIGGGIGNTIGTGSQSATLSGGGGNTIGDHAIQATIGGGTGNEVQAAAEYATVGGGLLNIVQPGASSATIGGGDSNVIHSNATHATIGGGDQNRIQTNGHYATIPGGRWNAATNFAFAAGNRAKANHSGSFVWADSTDADFASTADDQFSLRASGGVRLETGGAGLSVDGQPILTSLGGISQFGTSIDQPLDFLVHGQRALRLEDNGDSLDPDSIPDGAPNLVGGSPWNYVGANTVGGTIAGGGATNYWGLPGGPNAVLESYGTVGGGLANRVESGSLGATIAGGKWNTISTNSSDSAISGGYQNIIVASASATIAGGGDSEIGAGADYSTVGGGYNHRIGADSIYTTIGGGFRNIISNNATYNIIGGGRDNTIEPFASFGNIGGGSDNTIGYKTAYGVIGGGAGNRILSKHLYATIPGGDQNTAIDYGFAAGHRAKADHVGAFVWADFTDADFSSTADNQFNIRANGGVRINSGSGPGINLNAADRPLITRGHDPFTTGNYTGAGRWGLFMEPHTLVAGIPAISGKSFRVAAYDADSTINRTLMTVDQAGNVNATTFNPTSDRNAKENFAEVDPTEVLERVASLPISRWNFKQDANVEHVGPMAQDFHAAFGLGTDDKHIATVDADGVALAAIQGLNRKVEATRQAANARAELLEAENTALRRQLDELRELVTSLLPRTDSPDYP